MLFAQHREESSNRYLVLAELAPRRLPVAREEAGWCPLDQLEQSRPLVYQLQSCVVVLTKSQHLDGTLRSLTDDIHPPTTKVGRGHPSLYIQVYTSSSLQMQHPIPSFRPTKMACEHRCREFYRPS